ncbi:abortive infection system toxin AbiGii family protein [Bacillus swezeyi]|uniref:Uncharacterized protein n=1 Tax=Bacillus swezeyi TaxID=1925020 RepID=A0A5M8RE97_9BACI|nr:abortive infection system toxin AbiGii family protein [Bacillus swezeyi]KAA6446927.1 hypothetical protein DX927_23020 [Bacillus swezeyi]KAA6471495.1 hypothetical protein DX928_23260 [Bacillus swezeyi]
MSKGDSIKQRGDGNIAIQNSDIKISISTQDEIAKLHQKGDYQGIAQLLKQTIDMAGTTHPLYPYYRYKPVEFGRHLVLEHEPLSSEAYEKFPLSYKGRFNIDLGHYKNINDLLDDAYVKQENIKVDMLSLKTWLGENEVPSPNLEDFAKEGKWFIVPDPLPKPMKLKFYIKGDPDITIIDYLEVNISDIDREKGLIILDNSSQVQSKLLITLEVLISDTSVKTNVKIKPELHNNVQAHHDFLNFVKSVAEKKTFAFKNLTSGTDFITAPNARLNANIDDLEKQLKIIDKLYKIESYFNLTFTLPNTIEAEDWEKIEILESIMDDKPISKSLKDLAVTITKKEALKNFIEMFENNKNKISKLRVTQSGEHGRLELFKTIIPLKKVQSIYQDLSIKDLEKAKRKYRDFEEGEQVKVILVPTGTDNQYETKYFIQ